MRAATTGLLCLALAGCNNEQTLTNNPINSVAVTTGDFDYVAAPLDRLIVDHESYEGLISVATWSDDYDPEAVSLKVEGLLGSEDEIVLHDVVLVASGTRGLGAQVYNGLEADDHLVSDPAVVQNVQDYVRDGGILVVTDWAYDLVQAAWPDQIRFIGDGSFDAAQTGLNGTITARVVDSSLANALGSDSAALELDFSNWAVMTGVASSSTVHLEADVQYLGEAEEGVQDLAGAPMLVSFQPAGARGKVVLSSFHFDAQSEAMMDEMLTTVVADFKPTESTSIAVGE